MKIKNTDSTRLIRPHSLAATSQALRSGRLDLIQYVDSMCARVAEIDFQKIIQVFQIRFDVEGLAARLASRVARWSAVKLA